MQRDARAALKRLRASEIPRGRTEERKAEVVLSSASDDDGGGLTRNARAALKGVH